VRDLSHATIVYIQSLTLEKKSFNLTDLIPDLQKKNYLYPIDLI